MEVTFNVLVISNLIQSGYAELIEVYQENSAYNLVNLLYQKKTKNLVELIVMTHYNLINLPVKSNIYYLDYSIFF